MMKNTEASTQSPVETATSKPVPTTPTPTKIDSIFFLPRITSATVPRMGERTATMINDTLSVVVQ